jgi:hypothetical protein
VWLLVTLAFVEMVHLMMGVPLENSCLHVEFAPLGVDGPRALSVRDALLP